MFILGISDDVNQSFSFSADLYETEIFIKCPDGDCGYNTPIMDVYIQGSEPVLGLPLLVGVDILSEYVSSGCIPYDYGMLIVISRDGSEVTCEKLALGEASLIYLNTAESLLISLDF